MKVVITGSAGHLGEALVRRFSDRGDEVVGVDILASPHTKVVGSILNSELMEQVLAGADAVLHTATLHKPHVATHSKQHFIDVNMKGTQTLLEAAVKNRIGAFVFTSTTSTFGKALSPQGAQHAVWVTEELRPIPKNIYGVTKVAAEDLCQLASDEYGLPCLVLKTSRFFPEDDDMKHTMPEYSQDNIKAIEFLNRRVDIEDVVRAHEIAIVRAKDLKFNKFIISGTTPFTERDAQLLMKDAPTALKKYYPQYEDIFAAKEWKMFPTLGRIYVNTHARTLLDWEPKHTFASVLKRVLANKKVLSDLSYQIGKKGYHR